MLGSWIIVRSGLI